MIYNSSDHEKIWSICYVDLPLVSECHVKLGFQLIIMFTSLQVRISALNTLYQFPLSDELTSKNSEGIRKGLLSALADDDEQLAVRQSSWISFSETQGQIVKVRESLNGGQENLAKRSWECRGEFFAKFFITHSNFP